MRRIKVTNKKAEMSLTVVVSAVIALVVLVVLIYIFMNSSKRTSSSFGSCGLNGGVCQSACKFTVTEKVDGKDVTKEVTTYPIDGASCSKAGDICCARNDWLG